MSGLAAAVERAADILGALGEREAPLGPLTTYRVGGPAAILARVDSVDDLAVVHRALAVSGLPVLLVGRGSNLLVADRGFPGLAVVLGAFALEIEVDGSDVTAGGAVSLPVLARKTVAAGLTGLEWAVGVPGSVGGGVRMNAGGHGSDVASTAVGVRVFDLRSGEDCAVPASALGLRFRGSDLADHQVVVSARFALAPGDRVASEAELAEIVHWRREHQPGGQNAGSVFVNPVPGQLSAGEVIDGLGLRGLRIGTAEVSPKHANFIQADEGGSADDVRAVMAAVRARVLEARGIALRSEIRQIGFDAHDDGIADREGRVVKLLGRRKAAKAQAEALAAGTVSPDEVFVGGEASGDGGSAVDGATSADGSPGDGVSTNEVGISAAGSGGAAGATAGPITAPVPVIDAGASVPANGSAPGSPLPPPASSRLRFGFDEGADSPPLVTPGVTVMPASAVGTTVSATAAATTGEVPITARKVVTIDVQDDLEVIETTPFDPSPVELPRPGVDPRLRARRIQVRRDEGRKRLRWAVIGGAIAAVLIAAGLVLESPLFAIDDVSVTGATYTDPARLQKVVDQLDGSTLLGADLGKAEATLAADPWVKRVRVERRPLRGVRIEIVERVPVATYMGTDQRWRVLDADGRVMAVLDPPGSKPVDPLELTLAAPGPDLEAGATVPADLVGAASIVPRLPADLRSKTCSLAVGEAGQLTMTMCDGFVIDLGSPDRLRDKLVTTIFVLNTRADDVARSSGLNVGDPERPVLIQK